MLILAPKKVVNSIHKTVKVGKKYVSPKLVLDTKKENQQCAGLYIITSYFLLLTFWQLQNVFDTDKMAK